MKWLPRPWRAAVGAVLAVGLSFLPAVEAWGAKTPICEGLSPASPCLLDSDSSQWNWFWSSNRKATMCVPPPERPEGLPEQIPDPPGVCGPVSVTEGLFGNAAGYANPISPGHFGVSMKAGDPDMRAYVKFDTGVIPPGATIESMILTFTVSHATEEHIDRHLRINGSLEEGKLQNPNRPPATVGDAGAKIIACLVSEPWGGTTLEGGSPPYVVRIDQDKIDPADPDPNDGVIVQTVEPASDCGVQVTGRRSNDGRTWRFDVTSIAKLWASGERFNEGIVLMPSQSSVFDTWTIEFHGPELTVRPTVSSLPLPALPPEVPDAVGDAVDTATGQLFDLTQSEQPVVHINKDEGMAGIVEFSGGDIGLPPPIAPPPLDGGTGVLPPAAPPIGPVDPGTTPIDPGVPPAPPAQVGATTPATGFSWGWLPILMMGAALVASAMGAGPVSGAVALGAGNRVAGVLQRRRVGDVAS